MTERMKSVRQAVFLIALSAVLWSTAATAQGVPANCLKDLATADIINHDFSVSFCELCGVGNVTLVVENPYPPSPTSVDTTCTIRNFPIVPEGEQIIPEITAVLDDSSANSASTQFVNTANWDLGTYEIATQ